MVYAMRYRCLNLEYSSLYFAIACIFIAFAPALVACARTTPTSHAIELAQRRVDDAITTNARQMTMGALAIQLRYNPCPCDEVLQFEAKIYGRWQYVRLVGKREFVAKLIENASSSASKAPFEAIVILESVLYHSPSGQDYYTLQVFDDRSDGAS